MRDRYGPVFALLALLLFGVSLALLTAPAIAGIVIPMDDGDLIRGAEVIVQGRVARIESHRDVFGAIHTYVTVGLDEVLKGDVAGPEVTIVEVGGTVGDRTYWLFANPEFVVGERVLLFMDQRADGTLRTYHFYLGKFSIVTDPPTGNLTAVRGVPPGVTARSIAAAVAAPAGDVARPLDDFKHQIHRRIGEPRPFTSRARPVLPFRSAAVPASGASEQRQEFRFIGDPNPPLPVNPARTLVRWREPDLNQPVTMHVNATGEPTAPTLGVAQARAAMKAWSRVPTSSFRFAEGPPTTAGGFQAGDGISTISFRDPLEQIPDPVNCSGTLAIAGISLLNEPTMVVNGRTFYRALQGDVVVNNGWEGCRIFYQDFENLTEVLAHELGHVLGLGHSADRTIDPISGVSGATMEPVAHFDGRGAVLHADDKTGVTFIYPGRTLIVQKTGRGSGTITSGSDGIDCGTECVAGFAVNSFVALTATPSSGSAFTGFVEAGCESPVLMSVHRTCTARFESAPDLVVSAIAGPAMAGPGTTVVIKNTVRNNGTTAGPFSVGFYLSSSSAVTTQHRQLATRRVGGLATNATSADATRVPIPADVAPGSYVLGAIADVDDEVDEGAGEGNNAAATAILIVRPDLVVTGLTAPAKAGTGLPMTVHSAVKNQATVAVTAPASTVAFYLSTDARPGSGVRLAETRAVPALARGRTSTGATRITIPSDTPPGTYFLLAVADDLGVVDESDEGNNARAAARAIAVRRPDLTVRSVTAKPARGVAGMNVKVKHVVRNVAAAPAHAPASTSRLVLSNNTALGGAADVDLGTVTVAALAGGAHATLTTTVSIPDGTAPGRYWIYAVANDGGFPEAAIENNAARTTRPLTIGPDLLVTAANPSKTATAPGMAVNVTTAVANQGGATPADFDVGIYLSVNGTLDASVDTLLAARRVTGGLVSGARSGPIVTPVVIPSTASAGTYFLIVRADAGGAPSSGEVLEADETNNTRATGAIRIVRPDPTGPSVSPVAMP